MKKSELEKQLEISSQMSRDKSLKILTLTQQLEKVTLELAREREINNLLLDARKP